MSEAKEDNEEVRILLSDNKVFYAKMHYSIIASLKKVEE